MYAFQNGRYTSVKGHPRGKNLICKLDLKDAYVVVPMQPDSRRFLTFKHNNAVYQYNSLAFGISVAPRVFTKLMRYTIKPLRQQGIRLVHYLGDICLLTKSDAEMEQVKETVINHLTKLGFLINWKRAL